MTWSGAGTVAAWSKEISFINKAKQRKLSRGYLLKDLRHDDTPTALNTETRSETICNLAPIRESSGVESHHTLQPHSQHISNVDMIGPTKL